MVKGGSLGFEGFGVCILGPITFRFLCKKMSFYNVSHKTQFICKDNKVIHTETFVIFTSWFCFNNSLHFYNVTGYNNDVLTYFWNKHSIKGLMQNFKQPTMKRWNGTLGGLAEWHVIFLCRLDFDIINHDILSI
jgi:hypothetical protein